MQTDNHHDPRAHRSNEKEGNEPEVWFVRHGESEAHAGLAAEHTRDVCLTEIGRRQAQEIASHLTRSPELIICSPYRRAQETALPTCQRFSHVSCETWAVEEFTYLGSLAGVSSTKYERKSQVDAYWSRCDPAYRDGDGESFAQFLARVRATIERLKSLEGLIIIFTHEQFMRAAQGLLDGSMSDAPQQMARFRQQLLASPLPYGCIGEMRFVPPTSSRLETILQGESLPHY